MLHVRLHRIDPSGGHAHKSRGFEDITAVARFFATEDGRRWDWADVIGLFAARGHRSFSSATLRWMAACDRADGGKREEIVGRDQTK